MGQDIINCVCGKDVASIPVPGSEFDVENQPQIIENDPMKQSIMKSEQMKNENNNNFIQIKFNNNSNNNSNQIDNLSNNSLKLKGNYYAENKQEILANNDENESENINKKIESTELSKPNPSKDFDNNIENFAEKVNDLNKYLSTNIISLEKTLNPFEKNDNIDNNKNLFSKDAYKFKHNNSIYKGSWNLNGKREGYGIYIDDKGNKFEGYFFNDKFNGLGRLIDKNGNYFEGEFLNGVANGKGKLVLKSGITFIGDFINDVPNGSGTETNSKNEKYEGNFKEGKKNGSGKYIFGNGSIYTGSFVNNKMEGNGKFVWKDGREYNGEFKNNQMNGKGEFKWSNGKKYIGEYKFNKKEGFGKFVWNKDCYYEGEWVNNKQHGNGIYFKNGKKIKGIFRYGKYVKNEEGDEDLSKLISFKGGNNSSNNNNVIKMEKVENEEEEENNINKYNSESGSSFDDKDN